MSSNDLSDQIDKRITELKRIDKKISEKQNIIKIAKTGASATINEIINAGIDRQTLENFCRANSNQTLKLRNQIENIFLEFTEQKTECQLIDMLKSDVDVTKLSLEELQNLAKEKVKNLQESYVGQLKDSAKKINVHDKINDLCDYSLQNRETITTIPTKNELVDLKQTKRKLKADIKKLKVIPKTPKIPKAPKTPKIPKAPKTPKIPKAPKVIKTVEITKPVESIKTIKPEEKSIPEVSVADILKLTEKKKPSAITTMDLLNEEKYSKKSIAKLKAKKSNDRVIVHNLVTLLTQQFNPEKITELNQLTFTDKKKQIEAYRKMLAKNPDKPKERILSKLQSQTPFVTKLKNTYNQINTTERRGGMVPISNIMKEFPELNKQEFFNKLFELEKQRVIDLQIASDPKSVIDKSGMLVHPSRGAINYIVWRRL